MRLMFRLIPFKKELFTLVNFFWKPPESVYKHLHFKGVISVPVKQSVSFKIIHHGFQIENEIFWAGLSNGWEKESIQLWIKLCEESKVIVDIGANTGVYALVAKALNQDAKVFAFEPVKRVYEKLMANIELNNYDILAYEKAASNSDGTAIIYDTNEEHTLSVTVNKNTREPGTNVIATEIETMTLNSFVRNNALKRIDLLKIDVETHEPEVLEGFSEYLAEFRPTMLIEILTDEVGKRVEKSVSGLGYLYFNIDENGGIRRVEHILKSDFYNYLLCSQAMADRLGLKS